MSENQQQVGAADVAFAEAAELEPNHDEDEDEDYGPSESEDLEVAEKFGPPSGDEEDEMNLSELSVEQVLVGHGISQRYPKAHGYELRITTADGRPPRRFRRMVMAIRMSSGESTAFYDYAAQAGFMKNVVALFVNGVRADFEYISLVRWETGGEETLAQKLVEQGKLGEGDLLVASSVERFLRTGPEEFEQFVASCTAHGVYCGVFHLGGLDFRVADGGVRYLTLFNWQALNNKQGFPLKVRAIGSVATDAEAMTTGMQDARDGFNYLRMCTDHLNTLHSSRHLVRDFAARQHEARYSDLWWACKVGEAYTMVRNRDKTMPFSRTSKGTPDDWSELQWQVLDVIFCKVGGLRAFRMATTDAQYTSVSVSDLPLISKIKHEIDVDALVASRLDRHARCDIAPAVAAVPKVDLVACNAIVPSLLGDFEAAIAECGGRVLLALFGDDFRGFRPRGFEQFPSELEDKFDKYVVETAIPNARLSRRPLWLLVSVSRCHPRLRTPLHAYIRDVCGARSAMSGKAAHIRRPMTMPPADSALISSATESGEQAMAREERAAALSARASKLTEVANTVYRLPLSGMASDLPEERRNLINALEGAFLASVAAINGEQQQVVHDAEAAGRGRAAMAHEVPPPPPPPPANHLVNDPLIVEGARPLDHAQEVGVRVAFQVGVAKWAEREKLRLLEEATAAAAAGSSRAAPDLADALRFM